MRVTVFNDILLDNLGKTPTMSSFSWRDSSQNEKVLMRVFFSRLPERRLLLDFLDLYLLG